MTSGLTLCGSAISAVARARRKKTRNAAAPSGSTALSGHERFSAKTNDGTKAYAKVAELDTEPVGQTKDITVVDAVTGYLASARVSGSRTFLPYAATRIGIPSPS